MFYGTMNLFESLVSQTPSQPPKQLKSDYTALGYFTFTQTHYHQARNSKVWFTKLSKQKVLLTDVLCFYVFC